MKMTISYPCCFLFALLLIASNVMAQDTLEKITLGLLNDRAISLPSPEYPAAAKAIQASGKVNIQVTIDEKGNVISASAVSGHPLLRQAAEKAALKATFKPTMLAGKSVRVNGIIVYNFVGRSTLKAEQSSSDEKNQEGRENSQGDEKSENEKGEILNDKAKNLPSPVYPAAAAAVRATGSVNVSVTVNEKGEVTNIKAFSGHPLLRIAAEEAARQAEFDPITVNGKPAAITGILVYNFDTPTKNQE